MGDKPENKDLLGNKEEEGGDGGGSDDQGPVGDEPENKDLFGMCLFSIYWYYNFMLHGTIKCVLLYVP